jgi:diketogulonate reductase-like aldo/keto reductase
VVAIPKANRIEHVDENFGALEFKLDKEDIGKIDDKSRAFQQPPIAFRIKQRDFGRKLNV